VGVKNATRPDARLSSGEEGGEEAGENVNDTELPERITFVSHAPTAAVRRAAFPLDEPVEEGGLEKLVSMGWIPPRARRVYAGPELRANQTAKALGLEPVVSEELKDLDYGSWRGKSLDEVLSSNPDGVGQWLADVDSAPHGGEPVANLFVRVEHWLARQQLSGHTIAVTHPAVIRAAIVLVLEAPAQSFWRVDVPPASITDFRWSGRFWTLRRTGCPLSGSEDRQAAKPV
jgi:broad specificity phosphatase PhoE